MVTTSLGCLSQVIDGHMFNFFRNCQTIFQYSCNILHSHQRSVTTLVASHTCTHQQLERSLINFSHCSKIVGIPHPDFNLHCPNH